MARTNKDCLDKEADWIILEDVLQPSLNLFRKQVEFAIEKSGLGRDPAESKKNIHHVLLVGGPMHMPCVRRLILEVFANNRQVVDELRSIEQHGFPVNPMEAVARGAALNAQGAGPTLGVKRIARDYGVVLGVQGEILIHDGDGVPCEASLPGALGHPGQPGQAVPIGLYMREEGPDGESYRRMGDYEFVATVGPNSMSSFLPTLRAERDKTVSLVVTDLLSNNSMHLERLSVLDGRPIPKPFPFERVEKKEGSGRPKPISTTVSPERVSQQRRAATAALQCAKYALRQHPLVRSDAGVRKKLEEKIGAVEQALKSLPTSGPSDQVVFQPVAIHTTELIAFLQVHKLLSDEERQL
jgi:hypothetical protein